MSCEASEFAVLRSLMNCYYDAVLNKTVNESESEDPLDDEQSSDDDGDDSELGEDLQDLSSEAQRAEAASLPLVSTAVSSVLDKL
jgi:hypothetical protein